MPGLVRASDGLVRDAPHLRWTRCRAARAGRGRDGPARPSSATTRAWASLAEHLFGAARGVDDVVYLNGGASGIGGGLIVRRDARAGRGGYSGEFGQNRPGIASASDRRAGDGVLEDEVESRAPARRCSADDSADEPTLAEALRATRSVRCAEEIARQRRILATALANAVNVLNPSVVVLGGFLGDAGRARSGRAAREAVVAQAMPANGEDLRSAPPSSPRTAC